MDQRVNLYNLQKKLLCMSEVCVGVYIEKGGIFCLGAKRVLAQKNVRHYCPKYSNYHCISFLTCKSQKLPRFLV